MNNHVDRENFIFPPFFQKKKIKKLKKVQNWHICRIQICKFLISVPKSLEAHYWCKYTKNGMETAKFQLEKEWICEIAKQCALFYAKVKLDLRENAFFCKMAFFRLFTIFRLAFTTKRLCGQRRGNMTGQAFGEYLRMYKIGQWHNIGKCTVTNWRRRTWENGEWWSKGDEKSKKKRKRKLESIIPIFKIEWKRKFTAKKISDG